MTFSGGEVQLNIKRKREIKAHKKLGTITAALSLRITFMEAVSCIGMGKSYIHSTHIYAVSYPECANSTKPVVLVDQGKKQLKFIPIWQN